MRDRMKELQEALEKHRSGRSRWRCPMALRSEVVDYTESRRSDGESYASIAEALGLSPSTIERWCRASGGSFREVRVSHPSISVGDLSLVTPRGYRLEGLTAHQAVQVLREL